MIDINLTGVVDGCGLAVQELQRTGNDGVIVNVASMGKCDRVKNHDKGVTRGGGAWMS